MKDLSIQFSEAVSELLLCIQTDRIVAANEIQRSIEVMLSLDPNLALGYIAHHLHDKRLPHLTTYYSLS